MIIEVAGTSLWFSSHTLNTNNSKTHFFDFTCFSTTVTNVFMSVKFFSAEDPSEGIVNENIHI